MISSKKLKPYLRSFVIAISATALVSCQTGPYVSGLAERPGQKKGVKRKNEASINYKDSTTNIDTVYVPVDSAAAYGRFLQDAYENALQKRAHIRSGINTASLLTALTAIGFGATNTGGDTTLITALAASFVGISGQTLLTRDHEAAYGLGAQTIGCVLTAATNTRPISSEWLIIEEAVQELERVTNQYETTVAEAEAKSRLAIYNQRNKEAKTPKDNFIKPTGASDLVLRLQRLNADADTLAQSIAEERAKYNAIGEQLRHLYRDRNNAARTGSYSINLSSLISENQLKQQTSAARLEALSGQHRNILNQISALGQPAAASFVLLGGRNEQNSDEKASELMQASFDSRSDSAKQKTEAARRDIAYTQKLTEQSNILGEQLLNKIEEIRWEVNNAVRRSQPDILSLDSGLRTIVGTRLAGAGVSLSSSAGAGITSDSPTAAPSANEQGQLREHWIEANRLSDQIDTTAKRLRTALDNAAGLPTLRFPANAFTSCSNLRGQIQAIEAPAAITLSPTSRTITPAQVTSAIQIPVAIAGGSRPYSLTTTPNELAGAVSLDGSLMTINLTAEQNMPRNSPMRVTIQDSFGRTANFQVTFPATTTATQSNAGDGDGNNSSDNAQQPEMDPEIKAIQQFLIDYETTDNDGNPVNWLRGQTANISGLDQTPKIVDGLYGPVTRQVLELYLTTEASADAYTSLQTPAEDEEDPRPEGCPAAATSLSMHSPELNDDNKRLVRIFKNETDRTRAGRGPIDIAMIAFFQSCDVR